MVQLWISKTILLKKNTWTIKPKIIDKQFNGLFKLAINFKMKPM